MPTSLKSAKLWQAVVAVFFAIVVGGLLYHAVQRHVESAQCEGLTIIVSDSTQAQCAKLTSERKELAALKDAANTMHGTLVAGTKLVIKHDTVTKVIREIVTVEDSTGTRTAALNDTTADYAVHIDAVAPPKGNLKVGYSIVTPEREIEVGFVKRRDGYYAVASGRGVKTTESFFTPPKERPLGLVVGGVLQGGPSDNLLGLHLGYDVYGAVEYRASKGVTFQLRGGLDRTPYIGLAAEKRIW